MLFLLEVVYSRTYCASLLPRAAPGELPQRLQYQIQIWAAAAPMASVMQFWRHAGRGRTHRPPGLRFTNGGHHVYLLQVTSALRSGALLIRPINLICSPSIRKLSRNATSLAFRLAMRVLATRWQHGGLGKVRRLPKAPG
jgi:hypothetical protein